MTQQTVERAPVRPWWSALDRPDKIVEAVRASDRRKPDPEMVPMDAPFVDGWGPPAGFYSYFFDGAECAVALPADVIDDGMSVMYEAMREEGMRSLVDFTRHLVPVIEAIETFVIGSGRGEV